MKKRRRAKTPRGCSETTLRTFLLVLFSPRSNTMSLIILDGGTAKCLLFVSTVPLTIPLINYRPDYYYVDTCTRILGYKRIAARERDFHRAFSIFLLILPRGETFGFCVGHSTRDLVSEAVAFHRPARRSRLLCIVSIR